MSSSVRGFSQLLKTKVIFLSYFETHGTVCLVFVARAARERSVGFLRGSLRVHSSSLTTCKGGAKAYGDRLASQLES